MKKLLCSALICLSCITTNAATYYFSSSGGDDRRTSGSRLRIRLRLGSHWQSLMNGPNMAPGDFALLKRDDVFYGKIVITKSGTISAPITIGAYGTGINPAINGFAAVSGWNYLGNGIYESNELPAGSTVNIVTINGEQYAMGRFPNADAANAGYKIFEMHTSNSITDKDTTYDDSWVGAEVVIRTTHGSLDRGSITATGGGQIIVSPFLKRISISDYCQWVRLFFTK